MLRSIPTLMLMTALGMLSGCMTTPTFTISGTITRGGEKLSWPAGGTLLVVFVPENLGKDPKARTYPSKTETATSSYVVTDIPPGRYFVAIQQFDTKNNDALGHVYDPGHTEISRDVTQDRQIIDIDLPKDLPRRSKLSSDKGAGN